MYRYKVCYAEVFGITPRRGTKSRTVRLKRSWAFGTLNRQSIQIEGTAQLFDVNISMSK